MAKYLVDAVFGALADPTRRAVVQRLCEGASSVSQLASPFSMALPSFVQHLHVLERAGLLISRKEGRVRMCELNPDALTHAEEWLATHRREWEQRLDRLEAHIATKAKEGHGNE